MEKKNYSSIGDLSHRPSSPLHFLKALSIYFSEEDIKGSLESNGYEVKELWDQEEHHIHGSRFTSEPVRRLLATKAGATEPALTAFSRLIKQKLLQL